LVAEIHRNFTAFDEIMERNGLEKIKTIGDAYMAVCGLPNVDPDHAIKTIQAAIEIRDWMVKNSGRFQIRMGVHSGPVVAGIVGVKKYAFDIWGDTVNTAARMEQNSEAGKINISGTTYELIKNKFDCEYRGMIRAKNKGEIDMYFVNSTLKKGK
jgi:class 3 adenylate cyclase